MRSLAQERISASMKARHEKSDNVDVFIYVLIDPRIEQVFYVGSSENPKKRLASHIREARASLSHLHQTKKEAYITAMLANGVQPTMSVIEVTTLSNALNREQHWINALAVQDHPLTNRITIVKYGGGVANRYLNSKSNPEKLGG